MTRYLGLTLVTCLAAASAVAADEAGVPGTYLLELDDHHRLLTLSPDHSASQISSQQQKLNFSAGAGAWSIADDGAVTVRIVDFTYSRDSGDYAGPAAVGFQLTFDGALDGAFQNVAGTMYGRQFGPETANPLTATIDAEWTFSSQVTGVRITAE